MVTAVALLLAGCFGPPSGGGPAPSDPVVGSGPPGPPPSSSPPAARAVVGGFCDGSSMLGRSSADLARELDAIAATGATYLRIDVYWAAIEPQRGVFNWATTDTIVDAARSRGLKVLGILDY